MPSKYARTRIKYAKEHLKRVPLDLSLEDYAELKAYTEQTGESVNGFIKRAIREAMKREE